MVPNTTRRRTMEVMAFLVIAMASFCDAAGSEALRGGGSTLVDPVMEKWVSEYRRLTGVSVDYASVGSGKGIAGMTEKKLDFGCTDAPLSDQELKAAETLGGTVVHVPVAMGAVAPIYNLPEVKERLRFSGPVLAGIFAGSIHHWNAPELQVLNPKIALPDQEIAVVHRLDSSGTTYVWTEYLAKVSPEWKEKIGVGKTVPWPVGAAGKGNEGVAGQVKLIPWSIGYAQLTYGIQESLQYGSVQNSDGQFVEPRPAAVTAAAEKLLREIPEDLRFSITDSPGSESYPISSATWAVAYVRQPGGKGREVADFLRWVIHQGQQFSEPLHYAPLPEALVDRADAKIEEIAEHGKLVENAAPTSR
jgi:phosphate ABC transporter phosphate-binding protein